MRTKRRWKRMTRNRGVKAGYVTYPGKLTHHMTASVVATLPVSCCNIVSWRVNLPGYVA